mmetsp:Transcript_23176/g.51393  ORF Transcript_23176/g.51393 Transcript_23176/m.51393 type:complete len:383 (-) Transcript_23176:43-1191(-)
MSTRKEKSSTSGDNRFPSLHSPSSFRAIIQMSSSLSSVSEDHQHGAPGKDTRSTSTMDHHHSRREIFRDSDHPIAESIIDASSHDYRRRELDYGVDTVDFARPCQSPRLSPFLLARANPIMSSESESGGEEDCCEYPYVDVERELLDVDRNGEGDDPFAPPVFDCHHQPFSSPSVTQLIERSTAFAHGDDSSSPLLRDHDDGANIDYSSYFHQVNTTTASSPASAPAPRGQYRQVDIQQQQQDGTTTLTRSFSPSGVTEIPDDDDQLAVRDNAKGDFTCPTTGSQNQHLNLQQSPFRTRHLSSGGSSSHVQGQDQDYQHLHQLQQPMIHSSWSSNDMTMVGRSFSSSTTTRLSSGVGIAAIISSSGSDLGRSSWDQTNSFGA